MVTSHLTSSNVVRLFRRSIIMPAHSPRPFEWVLYVFICGQMNRGKKKKRNKIEWSLTSFRCRGFNYQTSNRVFLYTPNFSITIRRVSFWQCIVRSLALCPQYGVVCMDYCSCVEVAVCLGVPRLGWLCVRAEMAYRHRHARNYRNNKYNVNGRAQQCAKDGQQ